MSDFDTQINVGMNVEGVVTGTEKAKRSLKDLNTSARESGKSIDGMGDGGSKAADKVEAATRSMIGSIQRQTAALEAGDKSSRKYQESLAKMRGIDVGALKPYLDQLDAAKMKQDIAANSQKGLIGGFGGISTAALGAATAFVAVAAGVATMTKKVVDGLDALNDLKDATGASIENISAIEDVALRTGASFDVVSTSLIKLNQGLNNAKPGSDTENAINAIGLSVKDLKALDPAEAFRQIAVGLSGFADDANKARLTQELFGKSLKEVAPLLNDLAAAGSLVATVTAKEAEEAEKFNKELFNLSKTALDAARDMAGPLVSAINETIQLFREGAKEGKSFYSVLVDEQLRLLGLKDGPKEYAKRLNDISRELESGNIHQTKRNALLREQAAIQAKFSATPVTSYEETELARLARAPKPTVGNLPDQAAIKAAAAASAKALAELNKELAAQTKLLAENAGLTGTFANDWDRLAAIYKKGGISLEQLSEAQAKLLADQPAIKAAKDAEVKAAELIEKANKAAFESRLKHVESLGSGLDKLQEEVNKQAEYNDRLGLTKEAIAELDAVKLESQATDLDSIAIKKLDRDLDEEQYDLYKKQAAELRNLARLKRVGGEKEAALEVVKATNEEWKRGWEETDRLARDVFTTWAADGSDAAQKIGDTLKKALLSAIYEATLKPIAFQLYTSIAGGGGAAGAVQGASNALSGGSSLLSGLSSVTGAFGSSLSANFGATMSSFGSTIGLSIEGGLASIAEGTAASVASGLGSIAGALGPVAVGIGALSALKSAMDYKVEANGNALVANLGGGSTVVANRNDYTQTGGLFGGGTTQNSEWSAASAELTAYMDAQVKLVTESARAYGTALGLPVADLDSFKQQIEVSLTGLNADQAKEAINKAIGGFGDALVSANFGPALDGLKRYGETSSATLVRVATEITAVNSTLGMLGGKLLSVDAAGIKAADGLVQAMGGLEAFQQQTASYYSQYYSQEEQRMQTALSIQARLAQGGIDVSIEQVLNGTREQFRALVDSFKDGGGLMDEAGQKAVAALMAVAGAFAGITTASANVSASSAAAAAAATESSFGAGVGTSGPSQSGWSGPGGPDGASEAANAILQERKTLQDELDNLTMTSTELLEKQRNALDESNRALFDQIQVAKEAARVAEQNKSLQDEYNQLTMTATQLRALEREEIAEANLELFDRITALKAEQEAIATANNAVDAALAGVQRAIDAEKKSIEAARQAAQERVGILKSIVDSIGSAVDNLRGNVDSTKAQAARQANAFIDNALATAQASGYMPDADDLKDAISKATAGINRDGLSQFEYEKQQLILAGKLEALGAIADPQLTAAEEAVKVAETQLQVLDDIMEEARKQVDELRGIDTSVKSVEAAIAELASAILGVQAATSGGAVTINPGDYQANGTSTGALEYIGESTGGLSNDFWKTWATHMQNVYGEDAGYKVYNMAIERGVTAAQLEEILGMSAGQANAWALSHGLAAFDVGTNLVPRDMVAKIHEGEAIIPKAYNPAAGGVSGNARLESLVEGLTKEVQRLQAIVNDGNKSNERIATAVNGNPDRPVPIDVLENSAGLATA